MSLSKPTSLPALFGAAAVALTLALGGCGSQAAPTGTEETPSSTGAEAPANGPTMTTEDDISVDADITIPQDIESYANVSRTLAKSNDTSAADDFVTLTISEMPELDEIVTDKEFSTGSEETSRPASGFTTLSDGGIEMTLPSKWLFSQDNDGFVFQNRNGGVWGYMYSYEKPSSTHYDVQALACSVPVSMMERGAKNVEVIAFDTRYSEASTLCSAAVLYSFKSDSDQYIHYVQYVESKSYLNCIEFMGTVAEFTNESKTIQDATDSIVFAYDEAI